MSTNESLFEQDRISEDVDAAFFDADGDGDTDLYVVSGGSEYARQAPGLADRLYLNDGRGTFTKTRTCPITKKPLSRVVIGEKAPVPSPRKNKP